MPALRSFVALTGLVATGVACGGGGAPELAPLSDQQVAVGTELVVQLIGSDPDGDELSYSFSADVPDVQNRASITRRPDGSGVFRWTPLAADVGPWFFDFSVADGDGSDTLTIQIEVKSAIGVNSAPVFREPLGTGTTLDLSQGSCLDLQIVVEDQDTSSVTITQDEPTIEGATLSSTGGLSATWHWCPTAAQIAAEDRYTLVLGADDLTNSKTTKHYLIVLRKAPKPDCPGDPPLVQHTPMDVSTLVGLTVDADITDDQGLKAAPLFYYSTSQPPSTPDLGSMTQLTMELITGNMQSGTWAADVPNPVAGGTMGQQATLYYVIVAQDNDDADGDCDHLTQAPATSSYSMTVTNPGGVGGAGVCEACTADVQCGDASDLCVRVGTGGSSYCLQSCAGAGDCPTNYTCSTDAVTSIDGASGRQCVPNSNDCSNPGGTTCTDDSYEDNDSRTQASSSPALPAGTYNLVSCPGGSSDDDEDWFEITIAADSQVTLNLTGGSQSDLDLGLYDSTGALIKSSVSLTSTESVARCLLPGTYYVRVYAWSAASNPYTLTYGSTAMSCAPACTDDAAENDDNATQARVLLFNDVFTGTDGNGPYTSENNMICSNDEDWYRIDLVNGDTLSIELFFTQANSSEDLDLHLYKGAVDLTPCTEANPSTCSAANGQSTTSNESYTYTLNDAACTISNDCPHYVVVHGWSGAENIYDILIGLEIAP